MSSSGPFERDRAAMARLVYRGVGRTALVVCSCMLYFRLGTPLSSAQDVTLDNIRIAWEARENAIRSARFEWSEVRVHAAGTMLPNPVGKRPASRRLPPHDTTVEMAAGLLIDGNKTRIWTEGPEWSLQYEEFVPRFDLSVFDGSVSKTYYSGQKEGDYPSAALGFVNAKNRNIQSNAPHLDPLFLAIRPMNAEFARISLHLARVHHQPIRLPGSDSLGVYRVTQRQVDARGMHTDSYLDASRDFIVVRLTRSYNGEPFYSLDIEYASDDRVGWLPSQWRGVLLEPNGGRFISQFEGAVMQYELNPDIPDSQFRFTFPKGTEVADRVGNQHYLVKTDGGTRVLSRNELQRRSSWEDLGTTGRRAFPVWGARLFGLTVVAFGAAILWIACARKRECP